MNTKQSIFHDQAAFVRAAIPGYRILRRIVDLQRGGTAGVRDVSGNRRTEPHTYPLAAE